MNGWNIHTLKEYFEEKFRLQSKAVETAFEAADKATNKAESAQIAYNEKSNEFRAALSDQAKLMLSRTEADNRFAAMRELIDAQSKQIIDLQRIASKNEGGTLSSEKSRSQANWVIGLVIATGLSILGTIMSIGYHFVTKH